MAWINLIIGGIFEVIFNSCLDRIKALSGFEFFLRICGFLIVVSTIRFISFLAYKSIEIVKKNAVWTGIWAIGSLISEVLFLKDPAEY
ncbi:MAG: QacE family quaternary ammonium compound efflux SMR transporter [Bacteroidetes bacterium]|nr:QacE family quaternary ammonium compound efflux SMR transporter [Bacteroidota bacterium]